jgi:hypothetical protein
MRCRILAGLSEYTLSDPRIYEHVFHLFRYPPGFYGPHLVTYFGIIDFYT